LICSFYDTNECDPTEVLNARGWENGECLQLNETSSALYTFPYYDYYPFVSNCSGEPFQIEELSTCADNVDDNIGAFTQWSTEESPPEDSNDDTPVLTQAQIAGVVIGGLAGVILIGFTIYYYCQHYIRDAGPENYKIPLSEQEVNRAFPKA
jgi:hypothetical protein